MRNLILLASGWTGSTAGWYFMARRFKEEGFDCFQAVYPYRGYTPIQYSSRAIGKLIQGIRPEYDHCTFVGHSMGGLVGRHLIQRTEYGKYIDAYVSLGTPHQGTLSANLTPKIGPLAASARQMAIGSDFLKRLNSSEWPGIPALAISAGMEDVVFPRENTQFKNALNLTIPWTNHISLILDRRPFYEIRDWLSTIMDIDTPTQGMQSRIKIK